MFYTKGTHYNASSTTITYIENFEAIGLPYQTPQSLLGWDVSKLSAFECALWYCVQAYNISVNNNVLNQTIVDTWSTVKGLNELSGPGSLTFTDIPEHFNVNPNSSFWVNDDSYLVAQSALSGAFAGKAVAGEGIVYSGTWTEAIWHSWDDIGQLVANVATSMTNNIRQTSPAESLEMYAGQAYREKLFVQVRWKWMILPIALVVFSVLFLIATMIETRSNKVLAWKGSALALLMADVDQGVVSASQNGLDKVYGIANVARKTRVVLSEDNGVWTFRKPSAVS